MAYLAIAIDSIEVKCFAVGQDAMDGDILLLELLAARMDET